MHLIASQSHSSDFIISSLPVLGHALFERSYEVDIFRGGVRCARARGCSCLASRWAARSCGRARSRSSRARPSAVLGCSFYLFKSSWVV